MNDSLKAFKGWNDFRKLLWLLHGNKFGTQSGSLRIIVQVLRCRPRGGKGLNLTRVVVLQSEKWAMELRTHAREGWYRLIMELKLRRKKGKQRVGRGGEKMVSMGLGGQAGALKEVLESDTRGCGNNKVVWGKDSQVWIRTGSLERVWGPEGPAWRKNPYVHIEILKNWDRSSAGERGRGSELNPNDYCQGGN